MVDKIVKRDGRVVPFRREKISSAVYRAAVAVGGRDRAAAERVTDDVLAMLDARGRRESYPSVEEVQDLVEKALIERGHARTAKAYIVYRYEHALKRAGRESLTYSSENIPYRKLWESLSWATDHDCVTLAQLAQIVLRGELPELVRASEEFAAREMSAAVQIVLEKRQDLRVIIVAGPSSSGKTTTTLKVRESLAAEGVRTVPLAVDNYFYDIDFHPRIGDDDFDYETPQALDLARISRDVKALLEGKTVDVPFYNFKTGKREGSAGPLALAEKDVLLIDSLHGLFPAMTEGIPEASKFRLYVETLSTIKDAERRYLRWADIRMLRRIVRDMQFRNYSPRQTVRHWHLVRRSELRYIVPELKRAHAIVNSFLPYELPVMKARVEGLLAPLVEEFAQSPERDDAHERSVRILKIFAELPAVTDESVVPPSSLLREFIGGSSYAYEGQPGPTPGGG